MTFARRVASQLPSGVRHAIKRVIGAEQRSLPAAPKSPAAILVEALPTLTQLPIVHRDGGDPTIVMVTDTVSPAYLFGGVGTAILFAVSLAKRKQMGLRIVTRAHSAEEAPVRALLALYGLDFPGPIALTFSPVTDGAPVPIGSQDIVLTTSWWTTHAALQNIAAERIIYLIQEDERMFYAGGDEHLLCDEMLRDVRLRYVVNTGILLRHFQETGATGPAERGIAFEPAFPSSIYHSDPKSGRRKFVFYARPNHPRNLFLRGISAISLAVDLGMFAPDEWELHFAGVGIPRIDIKDRTIIYHDTVPWPEYAALVRQSDLGLSLMYTPHPSYPPLDMAASGAVVVTNTFGVKGDLSSMSANILTVPSTLDGIVDGLSRGAALAVDTDRRAANYTASTLSRSWDASFDDVLDRL